MADDVSAHYFRQNNITNSTARYDLAKMFLHCLNHWKLETPTARKQQMSSEDVSAYKVGKIHLCQSTE